MKQILDHCSPRYGHDGWALRVRGRVSVMRWTMCTTRREARELKHEMEAQDRDLFDQLEVVKVEVDVKVIEL